MTLEERITNLEARLAFAEARIPPLEANRTTITPLREEPHPWGPNITWCCAKSDPNGGVQHD